MKRLSRRLLSAAVVLIAAGSTSSCYTTTAYTVRADPAPPPPQPVRAHVTVFYDDLHPYGEWVWISPYGWVWAPYGVWVGWRPYTNGYWVYSSYGWTWVSYWDWGWAPFHYGRWAFHPHHGWVWIPGSVWGPAWVAWRTGGGYVGWAPLPPSAGWRESGGLYYESRYRQPREGTSYREGGAGYDRDIPSHSWSFSREGDLTSTRLREHIQPVVSQSRLIDRTSPATSYRVRNGDVVNDSLSRDRIEKATGRTIPVREVRDVSSPDALRTRTTDGAQQTVRVYRPKADQPTRKAPPDSKAVPPVIRDRHEAQLKELREAQDARRRALEDQHRKQNTSPPDGLSRDALKQRQQVEEKALREELDRERRLLESQQAREKEEAVRKKAPPTRYQTTPPPSRQPAKKSTKDGDKKTDNKGSSRGK